jgi:hypothetical protein
MDILLNALPLAVEAQVAVVDLAVDVLVEADRPLADDALIGSPWRQPPRTRVSGV